jgi:UDP-N-acetylglucosamine:LPS N-acetylglucosamine transferase
MVRRIAFTLSGVARPVLRRWLRSAPDVVISTYPLASQALGQLKERGRLPVPLVTYLTDFSVNCSWVHPAVDLHLALSEHTADQARARGARVVEVAGPVVPPRFSPAARTPIVRRRLRVEWGLPARVAVLVAGSWGVGDIEKTVADVTQVGSFVPVVLCGRNDDLRRRLDRQDNVVALGWTDRVDEILAAADVLVQNAGGLSCMEAFACGLPVISYRSLPGHGQHNADTMADAGVAPHARTPELLAAALAEVNGGPQEEAARRAGLALFVDTATTSIANLSSGRMSCTTPRRRTQHRVVRLALVASLLWVGAVGAVGAVDPDVLHRPLAAMHIALDSGSPR